MDLLWTFLVAVWRLSAEMAPYLLLGFLVAGFLHVFMPVALVSRHLGGESPLAVLKAALLGTPLPLCSCGVLPVAAALRRGGAGRAPTLAFLITTPVTGVDSILATFALMGGVFTLFRVGASVSIGIVTGLIFTAMSVRRFSATETIPDPALGAAHPTCDRSDTCDGCDDLDHRPADADRWARIGKALRFAFIELPQDIGPSMLMGLVIGGLLMVALDPSWVAAHVGGSIWGIVAAVAAGIPLYVCATGSIPIAAGMLMAGLSPGAALAFLIAGPSTNTVAIAAVRRLVGTRAMWVYLLTIFIGAILAGLLLDLLGGATMDGGGLAAHTHHLHGEEGLAWWKHAGAVALLGLSLALAGARLIRRWRRSDFPAQRPSEESTTTTCSHHNQETFHMINPAIVTLSVPDMNCHHCVRTIVAALRETPGVSSADADLDLKRVRVAFSPPADEARVIDTIRSLGYAPVRA